MLYQNCKTLNPRSKFLYLSDLDELRQLVFVNPYVTVAEMLLEPFIADGKLQVTARQT